MDSMENHECRTNSRGNCQTRKCIFDIQVINVPCYTLIADFVYSTQIIVYSKIGPYA
jgi:hypothetical protein